MDVEYTYSIFDVSCCCCFFVMIDWWYECNSFDIRYCQHNFLESILSNCRRQSNCIDWYIFWTGFEALIVTFQFIYIRRMNHHNELVNFTKFDGIQIVCWHLWKNAHFNCEIPIFCLRILSVRFTVLFNWINRCRVALQYSQINAPF